MLLVLVKLEPQFTIQIGLTLLLANTPGSTPR